VTIVRYKGRTIPAERGLKMRITVIGDETMSEVYIDRVLFNVYWRPSGGGYVREVTRQPGTLGQQVTVGLDHTGSMWRAGADTHLTKALRRIVKRRTVRAVIAERMAMKGV